MKKSIISRVAFSPSGRASKKPKILAISIDKKIVKIKIAQSLIMSVALKDHPFARAILIMKKSATNNSNKILRMFFKNCN